MKPTKNEKGRPAWKYDFMVIKINILLLRSLLTLATIIESRDHYTGGHTWRVSQFASYISTKLGLGSDLEFIARLGGLVHDIGKIGIPDYILNKTGKFTSEEFKIMQQHPLIGEAIVAHHPLSLIVLPSISEHHERLDGKGYPRGRKGPDLSVIGKVVAAADCFDAITSLRPYHEGMEASRALEIMNKERGEHFDFSVIDALFSLNQEGILQKICGHSYDEVLMISCPTCGPVVSRPKFAMDGDEIICPVCTKIFNLQRDSGTFVLGWTGRQGGIPTTKSEMETVDDLVTIAKRKVNI